MTNQKELLTRAVNGNTHIVELYYQGGGELPKTLSGMYTSKREALNAADLYLRGRAEKKTSEIKETKDA